MKIYGIFEPHYEYYEDHFAPVEKLKYETLIGLATGNSKDIKQFYEHHHKRKFKIKELKITEVTPSDIEQIKTLEERLEVLK